MFFCLFLNYIVFVLFSFFLFSSVDRESEIGDRKLESWTSGNLEYVVSCGSGTAPWVLSSRCGCNVAFLDIWNGNWKAGR